MTTKTKRHKILAAFTALCMLGLAACLLAFRKPEAPHVTATFLSITNAPRQQFARFAITNHSDRLVHFVAYRFIEHSAPIPQQAETIEPKQSAIIQIPLREAGKLNTLVELQFRRADTTAEEAREGLDSVLKAIGIRWPGLNPDSSGNHFRVEGAFPDESRQQ